MLKPESNAILSSQLRKNVHRPSENVHRLPPSALAIEVIRGIENQLTKKKMLRAPTEASFNPVWFLAETERNVFLWRNGYSLSDVSSFDFWVDIEALVEKRTSHLSTLDGNNPFLNPLWAIGTFDASHLKREIDYLEQYRDIMKSIVRHAQALSRATRVVLEEVVPETKERPLVLLPDNRDRSQA